MDRIGIRIGLPTVSAGLLGLVVLVAVVVCSARVARSDDAAKAGPAAAGPNTPVDEIGQNNPLPTEPGDHKLKFRTHIHGTTAEMSYLLHLPPDYGRDRNRQFPMLVFFHGIGECGTDLAGVYALGPMTLLRAKDGNPAFAASCPFIVLCPQCPPRGQKWDTDYIYKAVPVLVEEVIRKTRCDPDRVYTTGLSMGGLGTWCVTEEAPQLFAAAGPLSAMQWQAETAGDRLRNVAVWCVAGANDESRFVDGTRAMERSLGQAAADPPIQRRFTFLRDTGHEAFWVAYNSPQFYEWLLEHHRPSVAKAGPKAAAAGELPPAGVVDDPATPTADAALPTAPGHYRLLFDTKVGEQAYELDYTLYLPKTYKPGTPVPTMLFLHEQDTMGPLYHDICCHGPDLELEKRPALQNNFPFAVISPRLPLKCDWQTTGMKEVLVGLLDHVAAGGVSLDPARVYATGVNIGAAGAMKLAAAVPDRFAAVVPIVTAGNFDVDDAVAKAVLPALPGRLFVRANDVAAVVRASQLVKGGPKTWALTKLPTTANAVVDLPPYADRPFLTWLAQQHRATK